MHSLNTSIKQTSKHTENRHWHILGAGSIGCLFGYFLKERVTLLLKEERLKNLNDSGTQSFIVERNNIPESFCLPVSSIEQKPTIDNLLICTKANDTKQAIKNLTLKEGSNIVLLQNGMGNLAWLQQTFPKQHIYCASTTHGAFRKAEGVFVHAGIGNTYVGQLNQNNNHPQDIAQSLSSDQQGVIYDPDMEKRLWVKLAVNCAINPLTAIYQCRNGELLTTPEYHQQVKRLCQELDLVLHQLNILNATESILNIVEQVAQSTENNFSSMQQDAKHKRASEIDFIQGYLCQQAKHLNIHCPENEKILATIKEIEASY